ncbi:MAG: pyruvate dehydrogenase (acetyl-transferring), homodimeric type [Deltaproteobacteria bacterium]|nr:pyruvate dehydrogenase (acetyl-transferring), homodimeric type [Deltaproteobacteria bacterium]
MTNSTYTAQLPEFDVKETDEWVEALDDVVEYQGALRARFLLEKILARARELKIGLPNLTQTPYINSIPPHEEPPYPGDEALEKRIRRIIRWNAMAMVYRANKHFPGIGGHVATYASSASLYEIGFNHFFKGKQHPDGGDQVYFQGHAAPGIYSRAYLYGSLNENQLEHFRRETLGEGLSSYPHPWLMPQFWEFPTVSMGLGPIAAIYQARFNRYLHARGLKDTSKQRVWAFIGDGECDEPEALGAIDLAARERLENLTFVINANLQRLDGPVRGNSKIIQELEGTFRGAGWEVIKVIWGTQWDELIKRDYDGVLIKRLNEVVDGQFQKYITESGDYIRKDFFGVDPRLLELVKDFDDNYLQKMRRGGHSLTKVYAAYNKAIDHQRRPTVIIAQTVKGWTLGYGFAAANVAHQLKKLDLDQLKRFRDTLQLPIPDSKIEEAPYYHPGADSPEVKYMHERRQNLGGFSPSRISHKVSIPKPATDIYQEFYHGSKDEMEVSTTMAFVRLLRQLMRDKNFGKLIVPIIPDEARTFGMDAFFREFGIYSANGQKYEPVDAHMLLNYHEAKDGQLIEEGITEAGSMATFTAAGTAYATHNVPIIPFYMFYSMFGLQRIGDQAWAFGDSRGRGFLMGGTAGRTTMLGEGLQHQDGNSHIYALAYPTMQAYDPAYAYEVAVIIKDGLRRMFSDNEDIFYYITLYNENYKMPPKPEGVDEGIVKGMYLDRAALSDIKGPRVQLFGSGALLRSAIAAQEILATKYNVAADVWSVTSYQQLYREARSCERHNRLHPSNTPKLPYVTQLLEGHQGPIIATSDYVSELPSIVSRYLSRRFTALGTNGFGRSDTREALRYFFEVDAAYIAQAALASLAQDGTIETKVVEQAIKDLDIDPEKLDAAIA